MVAQAHAHGVRTLALTDHDRTTGWSEAGDAAVELGMTFIPGMELSAKHEWRSVHVLGYLFDPEDEALRAETDRIRGDRIGRAERIVRNIGRDYDLQWDDVVAQTTRDATVGRPHIADALIARGIVRDRTEAFDGILHPREGYYEPHYAPDPLTAVRLITDAGSGDHRPPRDGGSRPHDARAVHRATHRRGARRIRGRASGEHGVGQAGAA